jgi:aspartate carbamoyltransferase catalytic subunit
MALRHLTSVHNLRVEEIMRILDRAKELEQSLSAKPRQERAAELRKLSGLLPNHVLAALFFEPSTRTRLSFETAMLRAGGNVIHHESPDSSSMAGKGESLADAMRVVSSYADAVVLRHPKEGSARLAAEFSSVPVINGGDGGHEHPTQTLCDLFVIYKEWGKFDGVKVLLHGDLRHGRTVHSLAIALARLGADLIISPSPADFGLPDYVKEILTRDLKRKAHTVRIPEAESLLNGYPFNVDAIYVSPSEHGVLIDNEQDITIIERVLGRCDATYVTRFQRERVEPGAALENDSTCVNSERMKDGRFEKSIIMHPLPRVDELSTDLDVDERAKYFAQAAGGVPVRMALLEWLLSDDCGETPEDTEIYVSMRDEIECQNPNCVTLSEPNVSPTFSVRRIDSEILLQCKYCDHRTRPELVGNRVSKKVTRLRGYRGKVRSQTKSKVFFRSRERARELGYVVENSDE